MTISSELDQWTADLATATGYTATRDPDLIHPPVLFVDTPEAMTSPIAGMIVHVPVRVIGGSVGKQSLDIMLDMLPAVFAATGQQLAALETITVGDTAYNGYLLTVPVRIDDPTPTPPGPTVPSAPGTPTADNWIETGGGWQYDLHWALSSDDGGSPITQYRVTQNDGNPTIVNGNTGTLATQFSLTFPVDVFVKAVNAVGVGPASPTASITPPPP